MFTSDLVVMYSPTYCRKDMFTSDLVVMYSPTYCRKDVFTSYTLW